MEGMKNIIFGFENIYVKLTFIFQKKYFTDVLFVKNIFSVYNVVIGRWFILFFFNIILSNMPLL